MQGNVILIHGVSEACLESPWETVAPVSPRQLGYDDSDRGGALELTEGCTAGTQTVQGSVTSCWHEDSQPPLTLLDTVGGQG